MKVAQLLPELNFGGVERGTIDLANFLVSQGHNALIISAGGVLEGELDTKVKSLQIPISKKSLSAVMQFKALKKILLEEKPDIVHVRSRFPAWIYLLATRGMPNHQKPVLVSTFHGLYSKPWYSQSMAKSDSIISISNTVKQYIKDNYRISNQNIVNIYRGCDTEKFNQVPLESSWLDKWFADFPQTTNKKILLMPGRITSWKGIETFIELIHRLKDPSLIGIVMGPVANNKKTYFKKLKTLASDLNLDETKILFCDGRSDIENVYKISSIVFNLSSKAEPFGRTMIEAAACGSSVVGWDYGGVKESLSLLQSNGLAKLNSMDDLEVKVRGLLEVPDQLILNKEFTKEYQTQATLKVYKKLLNTES